MYAWLTNFTAEPLDLFGGAVEDLCRGILMIVLKTLRCFFSGTSMSTGGGGVD